MNHKGNFLIACGGTGGHLAPGIGLAERLLSRGHTCKLVVSQKEVDSRLCRKYQHLDFLRTPGCGFSWHPLQLLRFVFGQIRSVFVSLSLLKREKPDAVIAFGGFTAVGLSLCSYFLGIPLFLHEANRKPGRAIRMLARLCRRLYLPPGVRLPGLPYGLLAHPGYPLRREIRRLPKESARAALGLEGVGKLLVVLGGSQGAASLNKWVQDNIEFLGSEGISVYCVTGLGKGAEGMFEFPSSLGGVARAWFTQFTDRVSEVLSAADLVVSRAGAGAIAECVHVGTPVILIPYPFAADNHQEENARFLERQGGCLLLPQEKLESLRLEVRELIFNEWLLAKMRENMRLLGRRDAADWISRDLEWQLFEPAAESASTAWQITG